MQPRSAFDRVCVCVLDGVKSSAFPLHWDVCTRVCAHAV